MLYTAPCKLLQDQYDTKMIIYMNLKTNNMKLELKFEEWFELKELILNEIDKVGGFDQLSDELQSILTKLSEL